MSLISCTRLAGTLHQLVVVDDNKPSIFFPSWGSWLIVRIFVLTSGTERCRIIVHVNRSVVEQLRGLAKSFQSESCSGRPVECLAVDVRRAGKNAGPSVAPGHFQTEMIAWHPAGGQRLLQCSVQTRSCPYRGGRPPIRSERPSSGQTVSIVEARGNTGELVAVRRRLFLHRVDDLENGLADRLDARLVAPGADVVDLLLRAFEQKIGVLAGGGLFRMDRAASIRRRPWYFSLTILK